MKIIHCADLHFGSAFANFTSEKAKQRRDEILHSFERLCDYARQNDVKVVIIAGDAFDTVKITAKTRTRFLAAVNACPDIDFLYLVGNHDDEGLTADDTVPANLKFFASDWTYFNYDGVTICGAVISSANSVSIYDRLKLSEDTLNIVTLHGQVAGYKSEDGAEIISLPRLKNKNIDYLALGHVHSYSAGQLDERGIFAYSGCLDGRGFDETGEKGFVSITAENKKIEIKFVPFSSRKVFEYEYAVSADDDYITVRSALIGEITKNIDSSSVVKVILTGTHGTDTEIDVDDLSDRLNEIFFFAKVYDKTELLVDDADYECDKSIKGEFVRAVRNSGLSNDEQSKIIECGLRALKGEDL